jgi:hypothetical protein
VCRYRSDARKGMLQGEGVSLFSLSPLMGWVSVRLYRGLVWARMASLARASTLPWFFPLVIQLAVSLFEKAWFRLYCSTSEIWPLLLLVPISRLHSGASADWEKVALKVSKEEAVAARRQQGHSVEGMFLARGAAMCVGSL